MADPSQETPRSDAGLGSTATSNALLLLDRIDYDTSHQIRTPPGVLANF